MRRQPPGPENNQDQITPIKRSGPGGARPGAGRKKGSVDRATIEQKGTLSELARRHTALAIETLARVAGKSESDAAAVSAAVAILDRGYGKPAQAIELGGPGGGPVQSVAIVTNDPIEAAKTYQRLMNGG